MLAATASGPGDLCFCNNKNSPQEQQTPRLGPAASHTKAGLCTEQYSDFLRHLNTTQRLGGPRIPVAQRLRITRVPALGLLAAYARNAAKTQVWRFARDLRYDPPFALQIDESSLRCRATRVYICDICSPDSSLDK